MLTVLCVLCVVVLCCAVLQWNESEKTWDCPAHGSRWNRMGEIINGPAKSNLDKVEVKA